MAMLPTPYSYLLKFILYLALPKCSGAQVLNVLLFTSSLYVAYCHYLLIRMQYAGALRAVTVIHPKPAHYRVELHVRLTRT